MRRTAFVQNKIINIVCFCLFFCPANIYRPSLRKVRLGRPKTDSAAQFLSHKKKKNPILLRIVCTTTDWSPILNFDFHLFLKFIKKNYKKNSTFLTIYIIIIHFLKSGSKSELWSFCWCQRNLFHRIAMDNECLKRFWNFKTKLLEKCILVLFLI